MRIVIIVTVARRRLQWASIPLLLWILHFLLPSHGGLVHGIPAGRVETVGLALVLWIAAHRVRLTDAWIAAGVAIAAAVASATVPGDRV